ncbi:hypothetical protein LX36DRAFT_621287 [Colletotrichum falcatum]|nr:hypothetical protein LX36DRAFT_621287 [Colletotrichum falcatum]
MTTATNPISLTRALWLALLSSSTFIAGAQAKASLCYYPGGVQAAKDVPCDPDAEVSMCCGSVNACLSNGLCKDDSTTNSTGIAYARGTCSDPTWRSPICPQNCQLNQDTLMNKNAFDFRLNGVQVWQCDGQGFGVPGKFCCESIAEKTRCCSTPAAVFGPLIPATPGNAAAVQTYDAGAASPSATSTPTPADATSPPAVTNKTPAAPGGVHATSPTGLSDSDNDGDTSGGQEGPGNAVSIGVGVGVSVGAALLVFVGVVWWLRRKRLQNATTELDEKRTAGRPDVSGSGNVLQSDTESMAYAGRNISHYDGSAPINDNGRGPINSMGTFTTIRTVSSWGTGTYAARADPEVVTRASSDYGGVGVLGHYQMTEIDTKETVVTPPPQQTWRRSIQHFF